MLCTENMNLYSLIITVSVMGAGTGIGPARPSTSVVLGCGVAALEGGAAVEIFRFSLNIIPCIFFLCLEASVLLFFLSVREVMVTGKRE